MFNNTNGSMNSVDYDAQVSMIVSNTLKKEFDKLLADIKKQIPAQTQAIKNEVFTDYTVSTDLYNWNSYLVNAGEIKVTDGGYTSNIRWTVKGKEYLNIILDKEL